MGAFLPLFCFILALCNVRQSQRTQLHVLACEQIDQRHEALGRIRMNFSKGWRHVGERSQTIRVDIGILRIGHIVLNCPHKHYDEQATQ